MDYDLDGEGGAVLDRLHLGYATLSLQECVRPVPQSELLSLIHHLVPPQCHPEGTCKLPQASHAAPPTAPDYRNERGRFLHVSLSVNTQTKGAGGDEERMNLGMHVEAC